MSQTGASPGVEGRRDGSSGLPSHPERTHLIRGRVVALRRPAPRRAAQRVIHTGALAKSFRPSAGRWSSQRDDPTNPRAAHAGRFNRNRSSQCRVWKCAMSQPELSRLRECGRAG